MNQFRNKANARWINQSEPMIHLKLYPGAFYLIKTSSHIPEIVITIIIIIIIIIIILGIFWFLLFVIFFVLFCFVVFCFCFCFATLHTKLRNTVGEKPLLNYMLQNNVASN